MKPTLRLLLILTLGMLSFSPAAKKKIVFFGDSITQAGVKPGGYITRIGDLISKEGKADQYELVGAGIGGNKIYDLYRRMEEEVISKSPDLVLIYVGVKDVWHKRSFGTGPEPDKF